MSHEPPAALHPWGCSGNPWDSFVCTLFKPQPLFWKAKERIQLVPVVLIGAGFFGVEPGDWTEMQQVLSHTGGETWPRCARVEGAGKFCVLITLLELPWDGFSAFHIGASESQNLRELPYPSSVVRAAAAFALQLHTMRSSHATQIGQKSWKFPSKHAAC